MEYRGSFRLSLSGVPETAPRALWGTDEFSDTTGRHMARSPVIHLRIGCRAKAGPCTARRPS